MIKGQKNLVNSIDRIFNIFTATKAVIRPHFILTGQSGSGKSYTISHLCKKHNLNFIKINAAQLTKEGTAGNSISKALSPLKNKNGLTIIFVDEFDKLFISGNSNSELAHETTHGVQNEFLTILEDDTTSVFGDYGKYLDVSVSNCLFIFAGAFNNEENVTLDKLRKFGVKTEFLGRVGLVYETKPLSLEILLDIAKESPLLDSYLKLFKKNLEDVLPELNELITQNFENNTIGARMVNTIINQYFIQGSNREKDSIKKITFQESLDF